jgi:hypothetical protein
VSTHAIEPSALQAALQDYLGTPEGVSLIQNASPLGQDRLVRKETSLGIIREIPPPTNHIGDSIAPWLPVETDDVIFDYLTVQTEGLAPARAEDAESELAQKDDTIAGQGRASVIDWALKDHYDASDVNRARSLQQIAQAMRDGTLPLLVSGGLTDWNQKVANDRLLRRRKLDNRREKLIMDSLSTGAISYDDGKVKFVVDYGRPAAQQASNAAFDLPSADIVNGSTDWSGTDFDPIRFFDELNQWFYDTYLVHLGTVIGSKKVLNRMWTADKFSQRAGLGAAYNAAGTAQMPDLLYATAGWSPQAARAVVASSTGLDFVEYDAVYRTRPIGSNTVTNNRFLPNNRLIFLPNMTEMAEVAQTRIGFAKTLTSPHPEGNWTSGFYEWERSTVDPWGQDVGNGVKMFPVFPHMEYTAAVDVTLPA